MTKANEAGQEAAQPSVIHIDPAAVMQEFSVDRDFSFDRRKFLAGQVLTLHQQIAERDNMIMARDERIKTLETALIEARANASKGG